MQLTSDGLRLYEGAVEDAFGADVDYAQLIKVFGDPRDEERTVQPGDVQGNVLRNHAALALYFVSYNFCRVHKTLRMSPAMAGGLTDTLRDAEWIVGLIDAAAPAPGPRGPYKKRATVPISN